jgi:hypothetical protein
VWCLVKHKDNFALPLFLEGGHHGKIELEALISICLSLSLFIHSLGRSPFRHGEAHPFIADVSILNAALNPPVSQKVGISGLFQVIAILQTVFRHNVDKIIDKIFPS